jgi:HTH-type transcriptional regulator / antitoxin HigA
MIFRIDQISPIRDAEHLDIAIDVIDSLLDQGELTEAQQDYLDVLATLVKQYEDARYPMPSVSGVQVLRFLMEEHGLRQVDLVPIFGSKSIVSEVLKGKRQLNLRHVRKLSKHFHVPADVFIDDDQDSEQLEWSYGR